MSKLTDRFLHRPEKKEAKQAKAASDKNAARKQTQKISLNAFTSGRSGPR